MKKILIIISILILAGLGFYFFKDKFSGGNPSGKKIFCSPEQRGVDVCTKIYKPVCAMVQIQCIRAPCYPIKQTFGNSCEACGNPLVESYVEGACEAPDMTQTFSSEKLGLNFNYPKKYFVTEKDLSTGERNRYAVILAENTPQNRDLLAGKIPGTEGPPTISIFQNNLDKYTARQFVEGTSFSNFKLSDGKVTETSVGGEPALRYRATGLYENDNAVVVRDNFVYMFTVLFLSADDAITVDFEDILKTVKYSE